MKISNWFEQLNPFSQKQTNLYPLTTGYTAEECGEINCGDAELIGSNMQKDLDSKIVEETKVSRNKQVRTLQPIKKVLLLKVKLYILIHQLFLIDWPYWWTEQKR